MRSQLVATSPPTLTVPEPLPARRGHPPELHLDDELIAGHDLTTEASAVEPAEQRKLAGESLAGEHGARSHLSNRFTHQDAGQGRSSGEVAGEEVLIARQPPHTGRRDTWFHRNQFVDEQERWTVRQQIDRGRQRTHLSILPDTRQRRR